MSQAFFANSQQKQKVVHVCFCQKRLKPNNFALHLRQHHPQYEASYGLYLNLLFQITFQPYTNTILRTLPLQDEAAAIMQQILIQDPKKIEQLQNMKPSHFRRWHSRSLEDIPDQPIYRCFCGLYFLCNNSICLHVKKKHYMFYQRHPKPSKQLIKTYVSGRKAPVYQLLGDKIGFMELSSLTSLVNKQQQSARIFLSDFFKKQIQLMKLKTEWLKRNLQRKKQKLREMHRIKQYTQDIFRSLELLAQKKQLIISNSCFDILYEENQLVNELKDL